VGEGWNVGDRDSCPPFFCVGLPGPAAYIAGIKIRGTRLGRWPLAEPGSTSGRSVVVPAAADGVFRSSQYGENDHDVYLVSADV
jgi:hypothetical protein